MAIYYSKSKEGFYTSEIHKDNIPEDKVEISKELHKNLLLGQSKGLVIGVDGNGIPCLVDPPTPSDAELIAANNAKVISEIEALERDLQPRAMRDALLYKNNTRLTELDRQIAILRAQLK